MAAPFSRSIACPIMVGRAPAVEALIQLMAPVQAGQGRVAALVGEAGLGKTRLVAEARVQAEARGFKVLPGQCFQHDSATAYAPLLDLLNAHFAGAASLEALSPLEQALAQAIPEAAPLLLDAVPAGAALAPAQAERRRFALLTEFFWQQAAQHPTLVVLEDLHWSDESSLHFLLHLARRAADRALLLLFTYRPDDTPSLRDWQADLDRTRLAHEIVLRPLGRREVAEMAQALTGERLSPARLDRVYALSEGNPFAVEELLAAVAQARPSEGPTTDLPLPRSARAATQQRVAPLPAGTRQVLTLASALGRQFDFGLLQHLSGEDEPALVAHLKTLIGAHLLIEAGPDAFAFRHALTREAVYDELLARERRALHRVIAETLTRVDAGRLEARLADLSYHFYEATDWERTLEFARRAGEQAQQVHAARAAAQHFGRALEAAGRLAAPAIYPLHRARGQAYAVLGDFEAARRDFETALAQARGLEDRAVEWQSLLDLGGLWASRDYARTGDYYQQAVALARATGDPRVLARSLNYLGNWQVNLEASADGRRLHHEALAVFQAQGDQAGLAETLDLLGMAHFLGGALPEAAGYLQQAAALFQQLDQRPGLVSALATRALCAVEPQTYSMRTPPLRVAEAVSLAQTARQLAQANDFHAGEAYAGSALAFCLEAAGEYARGLEAAESALALAQEVDHRQWTIMAHCAAGALLHALGALPAAAEHLTSAHTLAQTVGSQHWRRTAAGFLAGVLVEQGHHAQADALLGAALEAGVPARTIGQRLCACARGELALARGDAAAALYLAGELSAAAGPGEGALPRVSRLRGSALARLQRLPEAEAELQAVLASLQDRGARGWQWRAQAALAAIYEAQGRAADAEHERAAAHASVAELAAQVPAGGLRDTFEKLAAAHLPQPVPDTRPVLRPWGGLTGREREVAVLVAQGRSNKEIAEALVVSERTAESHVSNILNKLGYTSRAQVAAWAVEAGLLKTGDRR